MKNTLTAIQVKAADDGKLFDGGGLTLVKSGASGKWVYRYSHLGRRREMGLGAWPALTLAEARKLRDRWAAELAAGRDPLAVRAAERADEIAQRDKVDPTLAEAVTMVFEARKATLRGEGKRGRWRSPLDIHVLPKIGRKRLSELHQSDIHDALKPIWRKKHPTAKKAWERLRVVLRESKRSGFECSSETADAARTMLGEVLHKAKHIPATPWRDIPHLYARLPEGAVGDCLRFMILTAVRMDGCRCATRAEFGGAVWTVPEDRVKGREGKVEDFRVPLSRQAHQLVTDAMEFDDSFLFASSRTGRPVTSAALEKALRALGEKGQPHGFRSSFRTWVQDNQATTFEVAETALGHVVGTKVQRSYERSDLLELRAVVMQRWADYVTGQAPANVIRLDERQSLTGTSPS